MDPEAEAIAALDYPVLAVRQHVTESRRDQRARRYGYPQVRASDQPRSTPGGR